MAGRQLLYVEFNSPFDPDAFQILGDCFDSQVDLLRRSKELTDFCQEYSTFVLLLHVMSHLYRDGMPVKSDFLPVAQVVVSK